MTVWRYRLTAAGWVGAMLLVLPTPIAAFIITAAIRRMLHPSTYEQALAEVSGKTPSLDLPVPVLVLLATATLAGFVMVLVGREMVTD